MTEPARTWRIVWERQVTQTFVYEDTLTEIEVQNALKSGPQADDDEWQASTRPPTVILRSVERVDE